MLLILEHAVPVEFLVGLLHEARSEDTVAHVMLAEKVGHAVGVKTARDQDRFA